MSYSDSIDIEASPDVVFARLIDLPKMGDLSPENTGGEWLNGARGPRAGAKFKGTNARNGDEWSTTVTITRFDAPSNFAFEVTYGPFRVAHWAYEIESTAQGCRVTETWRDRRNWLVRRSDVKKGFDRLAYTKESIRATLSALKANCESLNHS